MRHADKDPKPIGESPEQDCQFIIKMKLGHGRLLKSHYANNGKNMVRTTKRPHKGYLFNGNPFSYVKTLDWAEGYLFDFVPPADKFSNKTDAMGSAYNSGGAQERFICQILAIRCVPIN